VRIVWLKKNNPENISDGGKTKQMLRKRKSAGLNTFNHNKIRFVT
jgi:hypothetical protein